MLNHNIFTSTKHWKFTAADHQAEQLLLQLQERTRADLSQEFYSVRCLTHFAALKSNRLYKLMKTIPKGALHHLHYSCTDDAEFYRQHILTDPRVYLSESLDTFYIGTSQEAELNNWVSMQKGIQKNSHDRWVQMVAGLACFTQQEINTLTYQQSQIWDLFESKIKASRVLLAVEDIFEKYTRHFMQKYKDNGYQRIEVRNLTKRLKKYDQQGNYVGEVDQKEVVTNIIGKVAEEVSQGNAKEFFGYIESCYKFFTEEQSEKKFRLICQTDWPLLIGFDFVNEEDKFQGLQKYDPILDKVLADYPHLSHLKKMYHAGETTCHRIGNVDVAIKAGAVRIGHGLNILQRMDFLPHCRHTCFEKNPISNIILGYNKDLREASAPILLGLGYPVSISPDDPGKFGLEATTQDYFVAATAYNWTLKHLKLIAYHSINHSVCQQTTKTHLVRQFEAEWDAWVQKYLVSEGIDLNLCPQIEEEPQMFSDNLWWSFSPQEQAAERKFKAEEQLAIDDITEDMYSHNFSKLLTHVESLQLLNTIASIPKAVLHSCHLHYCHDLAFFEECPQENIRFWVQTSTGSIATLKTNPEEWISHLELQIKDNSVAAYLYQLTSLSPREMAAIDNETQFWQSINKKKENIVAILRFLPAFQTYLRHVLSKFVAQGYERVQFRVEPLHLLTILDESLPLSNYFMEVEAAVKEVQEAHPHFSVGLIVLANKQYSHDQNKTLLEEVCKLNHPLVVGFDFEAQQPEGNYPPLQTYDQLLQDVLDNFQQCQARKYYQAGNTKDHLSPNIKTAIMSGTQRLANSCNILQQTEVLPRCQKICFEVNPVWHFLTKASSRDDFRLCFGSVLLGLKVPVSIGCDYAGLLGLADGCTDLALMVLCSNWSLKHLKLLFLHSLQYAAATEGQKIAARKSFTAKWNSWIHKYLNSN